MMVNTESKFPTTLTMATLKECLMRYLISHPEISIKPIITMTMGIDIAIQRFNNIPLDSENAITVVQKYHLNHNISKLVPYINFYGTIVHYKIFQWRMFQLLDNGSHFVLCIFGIEPDNIQVYYHGLNYRETNGNITCSKPSLMVQALS